MIGFSELRAQAWKYATLALGALAVVLLIVGLFLWIRGTRADARADAAEQRAEASEARAKAIGKARDLEAAAAKRANAIADQYEKDKTNAEADAKRLAAELRAGDVRLRSMWKGCPTGSSVPEASGAASQPDAEADDRAESASRIVRAAKEADAQITGLQEFIRSEREAGIVK